MRRIITTTDEHHPDTPASVTGEGAITGACVWQVFIDGQPFVGVPSTELGAVDTAWDYARQAIDTGRYEYVDLRLVPERRCGEADRRHDQLVGNAGDARTHDRRAA